MPSFTVGMVLIVASVIAALITGRPDPVLWALLFFIVVTVLSYAGLASAKKVIKRKI